MYKFLIAIGVIFCTGQTLAQTCIGGEILTTLDKTKSFCVSTNKMNWWSAYQWCQEQGRKLVDIKTLCAAENSKTGWDVMGNCDNFYSYSYPNTEVWTSTTSPTAGFARRAYLGMSGCGTAQMNAQLSAVCQ